MNDHPLPPRSVLRVFVCVFYKGKLRYRPASTTMSAAARRAFGASPSSPPFGDATNPEEKREEAGGALSPSELRGKTLVLGGLSLNRYPVGWTYKIRVNQRHDLRPKKVPRWTVWLELPVGDSVSLEARSARQPERERGEGEKKKLLRAERPYMYMPDLDYHLKTDLEPGFLGGALRCRLHAEWVGSSRPRSVRRCSAAFE